MADASKVLDVSTVLQHLQAIFEQEGLADLKITFPYTPEPGSWQAALQEDGLTGLTSWLLADTASALKQRQQPVMASKKEKEGEAPKEASPAGPPKEAAPPQPGDTLAFDVREAARHIGQLFSTMLQGQSSPAGQPPASEKAGPAIASAGSEALTAFNQMLHRLIPGKDAQGGEKPTPQASPGGKSPAVSTPSQENPTDWRFWANQGLGSLNQYLHRGIQALTRQGDQMPTQEQPKEAPGPGDAKPRDQVEAETADKSPSSPPKETDDSDEDTKPDSDSDTDSQDTEDTDGTGGGDKKDTSTEEDTDSSNAYDGERDHLLDVGEG